jgi:hypothetical protein
LQLSKPSRTKILAHVAGVKVEGMLFIAHFGFEHSYLLVHRTTWVAAAVEHFTAVVKVGGAVVLLLEQWKFLKCLNFDNLKHFECWCSLGSCEPYGLGCNMEASSFGSVLGLFLVSKLLKSHVVILVALTSMGHVHCFDWNWHIDQYSDMHDCHMIFGFSGSR